ncbi:hypothetical protein [Flavobacterium suncheonense]|uniref:Transglutaminase-like domain-containing protein n=1 Tax=Flavobacterium suncheonense GH29-5 = DSM 17707 TaxID=1121899 RepID=A0A0A2MD58_9FLAO|nr:hypothetical protein [Flavobacterium suncheonense]KGO89556.1 hypothetical protein Q764_07235 [Flavobacterium suncheonense GH29-5 = DSM 17707]
MDAATVNRLLRRELKPFDKWVDLIPAYEGSQYDFEAPNQYSDTDDTLVFMANCVEKTAHQLVKVAPLLKGNTLTETVDNIYKWLYNHFQYKLDETTLQHLYKPSAAVYYRKIGFDCKTFSTLASSLLSLLKIPHAFRKVKQKGFVHPVTGELVWSHVYVVVPNGSQTLVVDATTHNNREVSFVEKYDYDMTKVLKHVMLGSPAVTAQQNPYTLDMYGGLACPGQTCNCGGSGSLGNPYAYGYDLNELYTLPIYKPFGLNGGLDSIKSFQWSDIKTLFSKNIDCIGGTAYNKSIAEKDISTLSQRLFGYLDKINQAVIDNDMSTLSFYVNQFIGDATWNASIAGYKRADKDWNSCSASNLKAVHEAFNFYRYTATKALKIWLDQYFTATPNGTKYYGFPQVVGETNTKYYGPDPIDQTLKTAPSPFPVINAFFDEWISYDTDFLIFGIPYFDYALKPGMSIPKFEITQPVLDANANINLLTPQTLLSTLTTVIRTAEQIVTPTTNGTTSQSGTYDASTGAYTGNPNTPKPKPQNAGTGLVIGAIVAWAGWSIYQSSKKSKPNAK